ncbi:CapA family protein [Roseomonas marmotae]|uniref:CapA family protein n=1 Tax=Roseomonas marmotae TaxID=2768161 RepID=A0ABS3KEK8_9PROT|nr:CapA family protein [Roseomonas marmotae]MBO1075437.1 CapA family protein [Roseomonas marmotae]QTI81390.1 CapA family protein [Roseomonas marmotae]
MTSRSPLRIALTGDSILMRRLGTLTDPQLRPLFDIVRDADVAFTNLECLPNGYRGDPALESGGSHFAAPPWVIDELVDAGFDLFATATNHCLDYSISGLLAAKEELDRRGVLYAGIGQHLGEARMPVYREHPHGTVAMLSCASTFAKGQEASPQTAEMQGRPGLNPLRFDTVHQVTPAQLSALRGVAEQLGLEKQRQSRIQLGFGFPLDDPDAVALGDMVFSASDQVALRTKARAKDLDAIARWIREARLVSDVVMVSVHAHEQGASKEDPAEFLVASARQMIDEGADMVVGHGPHLLRGMEIYRGKPIFYSLGNFIGQNELVARLPMDSYERFRADPALTPAAVYRKRTDDDRKGFPSDRRFWETVMPVCIYAEGKLSSIDIHPVTLGLGEARHLRGRPRLAEGEEARSILRRFAALSAPFGVTMDIAGDKARVTVA